MDDGTDGGGDGTYGSKPGVGKGGSNIDAGG